MVTKTNISLCFLVFLIFVGSSFAAAIEGKWYGYSENDWGQISESMNEITSSDKGGYLITVYETADKDAYVQTEIRCKLTDGNTLVFERGEDVIGGKGTIAGGVFKGEYEAVDQSGKFELHRINGKSNVNLVGKWQGHKGTGGSSKKQIYIVVVKTGDGQYLIEERTSFDAGAETLVSLKGRVDDSGQISFTDEDGTGQVTGKGFCSDTIWIGTYQGDEYGWYRLQKVTN